MRAHRRCSARYSGSTNPPPSCCCVFICRCLGLTHPHPFPAISGRTRFFDAYGTTRDVLQNHLTEMMALVALAHEQPVNPAAKAAVLKQVITTTTTFCCTQTSPSFGRNAPRQSNNSPDNQPSPPPKKTFLPIGSPCCNQLDSRVHRLGLQVQTGACVRSTASTQRTPGRTTVRLRWLQRS